MLKNGDLRTLSDCRRVFEPYRKLIQKIQTLAYQEYASALNFFRASHLTIFEHPAVVRESTIY